MLIQILIVLSELINSAFVTSVVVRCQPPWCTHLLLAPSIHSVYTRPVPAGCHYNIIKTVFAICMSTEVPSFASSYYQ